VKYWGNAIYFSLIYCKSSNSYVVTATLKWRHLANGRVTVARVTERSIGADAHATGPSIVIVRTACIRCGLIVLPGSVNEDQLRLQKWQGSLTSRRYIKCPLHLLLPINRETMIPAYSVVSDDVDWSTAEVRRGEMQDAAADVAESIPTGFQHPSVVSARTPVPSHPVMGPEEVASANHTGPGPIPLLESSQSTWGRLRHWDARSSDPDSTGNPLRGWDNGAPPGRPEGRPHR